jgi:uncharacterized membrane protein YccC
MSRAAVGRALIGAARVTIPACIAFYLCAYVLGSAEMAAYAVFGVLALGAFSQVEGTGPERSITYLWSLPVGLVLVALGTALAGNGFAAAAGMLLVGFAVTFAGIGGPRFAGPAVGLQLFYILPCFPPYSPGSLDDRLIGLAVGIVLLILADRLLWPRPDPPGFRARLADALDQTARFAGGLRPALAAGTTLPSAAIVEARRDAERAAGGLRLSAVPVGERPAGPSRADQGLTLAAAMLRATCGRLAAQADRLATQAPDRTMVSTAELVGVMQVAMADAAAALRTGSRAAAPSPEPIEEALARHVATRIDRLPGNPGDPRVVARVRLSVGIAEAADDVRTLVMAVQAALGAEVPAEDASLWFTAAGGWQRWWHRIRENLTIGSVYLQNAVRLAVGLALARLLVDILALEHGLWVLLATLTLMRTSAAATRAALLPAFTGVIIGATLAGALLFALGPDSAVYAIALPPVMLVALAARPLLGVVAGQAGVTFLIVLLFAQLGPADWQLAETRLLDVVIGGLIGAAIGLAIWPRGGGGELRRTGASALRAAADHLSASARWLTGVPVDRAAVDASADAVRRFVRFGDVTYAQYRSEATRDEHPVDWLVVLGAVRRTVRGSTALRHRYPSVGPLPWPALTTGLLDYADRIAAAQRAIAAALTSSEDAPDTIPGGLDSPLPDLLAAEEPDPRGDGRPAKLRVLDIWAWLRGLADDQEAIRSAAWTASQPRTAGLPSTSR